MKKALLVVVSLLGVVSASVALAAVTVTRVVAIKPDGFSPVTRTIQTGDAIRWRNDDTVNHQVVADNGHFASPVLRPRQTYQRTFNTAGTFRYRDALEPAERGTIIVRARRRRSRSRFRPDRVLQAGVRLTGFISSGARTRTSRSGRSRNDVVHQSGGPKTGTSGAYDFTDVPQVAASTRPGGGRARARSSGWRSPAGHVHQARAVVRDLRQGGPLARRTLGLCPAALEPRAVGEPQEGPAR